VAATLLLALLALAGCVNIPTSGPVERVEGQQPGCQTCLNIEVAPPAPGDDPRRIVDGYLRANANFQPNYSVARQFLTRKAAETWSSADSVSIYTGQLVGTGADVTLVGRQVGALDADRTFIPRDLDAKYSFGLVQEDGEWRIDDPPPGLLVAKFAFDSFYERYDLFFVGSAGALVPDSVHLPDLRAPANVASTLVTELLEGPSRRLAPVVRTAAPPDATLDVDSVTLVDGVARVPLSEDVAQLPDRERTLLAAQLVYTLKQVIGVKRVLLQFEGRPVRVPGSQADDPSVPVDASFGDLAPVDPSAGQDLFVVRRGAVQRVAAGSQPPQVESRPGDLGEGRGAVEALAVSGDESSVAVVTDGGTRLSETPTRQAALAPVLTGVTGLLRPQYTRAEELWAVGERGGRQQLWVTTRDGRADVSAPVLDEGRVLAFRVSPDGARVALLVRQGARTALGVARVNRADTITVDGWRALDTSTPLNTSRIAVVQDVAWADAGTLVVLGSKDRRSPAAVSTVSADGAEIETEPQTNDWRPVSLAVAPQGGTAVVVAGDGAVLRDDGNQWAQLLRGVTAAAYPG